MSKKAQSTSRSVRVPIRVMVTGGSGQVGSEIRHRLQPEHRLIKNREVLDVRDRAAVLKQVKELRPSVIVNAAGITDESLYGLIDKDRQGTCHATNAIGAANVFEACLRYDAAFIQLTPSSVFPTVKFTSLCSTPPWTESAVADGVSGHVAASKLAAEHAIFRMLATTDKRVPFFIVRTSMLYERPWRSHNNFAYSFQSVYRSKPRNQQMVLSASAYRSFTYVPHLVDELMWLIKNVKEIPSGVYHIANPGCCSFFDFGEALSRMIGVRGPTLIADTATEPQHRGATQEVSPLSVKPAFSCLSCQKWYKATGRDDLPDWYDALSDFSKCLMGDPDD